MSRRDSGGEEEALILEFELLLSEQKSALELVSTQGLLEDVKNYSSKFTQLYIRPYSALCLRAIGTSFTISSILHSTQVSIRPVTGNRSQLSSHIVPLKYFPVSANNSCRQSLGRSERVKARLFRAPQTILYCSTF
jgi:hypothetical protein